LGGAGVRGLGGGEADIRNSNTKLVLFSKPLVSFGGSVMPIKFWKKKKDKSGGGVDGDDEDGPVSESSLSTLLMLAST
jgi:hypothetical protein